MKKMMMAVLLMFGFSTLMMAQTSTKSIAVKPAPKMSVAKTNSSTHVSSSVTPAPKPVTTSTTKKATTIGKKHKAKKPYKKTAKADAKTNKAAARHLKRKPHGQ